MEISEKQQKINALKELFANDRFATDLVGVEILDADDGYGKCRLEIKDIHMNAGNHIMGGAIYTLADLAFAIAANYGDT